ncbi:unnamed protein product [Urochloa humidicola]
MKTIRLAGPSFTFRASASNLNHERRMECFPFADCKVLCVDQSGRGFLFDADTHKLETMPILHTPKVMPIFVFVPRVNIDNEILDDGNGSSLYLMEKMLQPEATCNAQENEQFVGIINHRRDEILGDKSWHCHLLPPPPFVREPCNWNNNSPQIKAYGMVGYGSHICVSFEGIGTYSLDTAGHTWSEVGKWTLPFHGKVEYVPELKLWFGLSADSQHLAAADLSSMDSQPQLVGPWKELDLPEEWYAFKDSQFVSLGSGKFCVARFFQAATIDADYDTEVINETFVVLTGVEVSSSGKGGRGEVNLQMTPHKSRRVNNTSIETFF